MSEVLKMDIFFVISSIGTVVLFVLGVYVLYQASVVLKYVRYILKEVNEETQLVRSDISTLREGIKGRNYVVLSTLLHLMGIKKKRSKSDTKL